MLILLDPSCSGKQLIKFYGLLEDAGIYKIGVLVQINTSEHPRPVIKPAVEKLNEEHCGAAEKLCNFIIEYASEYLAEKLKYWTTCCIQLNSSLGNSKINHNERLQLIVIYPLLIDKKAAVKRVNLIRNALIPLFFKLI